MCYDYICQFQMVCGDGVVRNDSKLDTSPQDKNLFWFYLTFTPGGVRSTYDKMEWGTKRKVCESGLFLFLIPLNPM